jgi:hypothetical protein
MALDKTDLEYIKNTIDWLNEHTVLIDDNRTNCETLYSSVQNSLQALESALAKKPDASENTLPIQRINVSDLLEERKQYKLKEIWGCDYEDLNDKERLRLDEELNIIEGFFGWVNSR